MRRLRSYWHVGQIGAVGLYNCTICGNINGSEEFNFCPICGTNMYEESKVTSNQLPKVEVKSLERGTRFIIERSNDINDKTVYIKLHDRNGFTNVLNLDTESLLLLHDNTRVCKL